jgi:opacity protein-like surface antigen
VARVGAWKRIVIAMGALVCVPGVVHAQGVRVAPQVGLYVPVSDFGRVTEDGIEGTVDLGKKEATLAYGLGLDWWSRSSLGLRGSIAYATDSDVPISGFGCATCSTRSTMLAVSGSLVLRPVRLLLIDPYVMGGVGVARYDVSSVGLDDGLDAVFDDRNELAWHLGLGGELTLRFADLLLEVSDYITTYQPPGGTDSHRRHDVLIMIGVGIGGKT